MAAAVLSAGGDGAAVWASVIIPTYQRREVVLRTVSALERQTRRDFEVVVVVDGSTDGTAAALRELSLGFPLTVLEQPNTGQAAARDRGVASAAGELLLFIDDDMEADPLLLEEHHRSHHAGADVVMGDLPLSPRSPRNLLSWGVGWWASARRRRLTAPGAEVRLEDLLTGQVSVSRSTYEVVGGFDSSFTRDGLFGGEDIDFGYRLVKAGYAIAFNPAAITHQYYDVDPGDYLKRTREAGRSDQELLTKHPELAGQLAAGPRFRSRRSRLLLSPLVVAPPALSAPLRAVAVALARSGHRGDRLRRFFFSVRTLEYLRGARLAAQRPSTGTAVVLAYHAISDLRGDPVLGEYGIPPDRLAAQLDMLAARGRRFVGLDDVLAALTGRAHLPAGATLITFDDAYADLLPAAREVLADRRIEAVVFAVADQIGGTNEWDRAGGAASLQLLDPEQLQAIADLGVEVGSHGLSHTPLSSLGPAEIDAELRSSASRIEAAGLPRPRAFSYPHGAWNAECASATARAGYAAAFTIDPGVVHRGSDPRALPRIEVLAGETDRSLALMVKTAGWPAPLRKRLLRLARML